MKYIFLELLLIISFVTVSAQNDPGEILDKVSAELKSHEAVQADFSFTLENKEADIFDSYEGSLVMQSEKYKLSLMGMTALSDGKAMWIYMEEFNEVNIMDPSDSDFFNPKDIFNIYKDDFKLKYLGKEDGLHKIELVPLKENDNYRLLIIKTDPVKNQIKEVFYEGTDGNNYVIKIKNMLTEIQIEKGLFTFDKTKYPGVEIFDMR